MISWNKIENVNIYIPYITANYPHRQYPIASDTLHKWLHRKLSEVRKQNSKEGRKIQPCICRAGLKREKWLKGLMSRARVMGTLHFLSLLSHTESGAAGESHCHWTLPPSPLFGINGSVVPSFFPWLYYIFDNQQQWFLFCRLNILVFLSPTALLPPFYLFRARSPCEQDPISAAHTYRVLQGGPSVQLRAFKSQCNYYSVGIRCVPRSCKPICLHRNIQISGLFCTCTAGCTYLKQLLISWVDPRAFWRWR